MSEGKQLQVVLTTGVDEPERASFALNTALVAVSAGVDVTLFLALRAPEWACHGALLNEQAKEVAAILDRALEAGVDVEACSACFEKYCLGGRPVQLREGFRMAGMMTFVRRSLEGVQTITF